jgi:ribosomal protein S18 acetylase RimI-like enzyme
MESLVVRPFTDTDVEWAEALIGAAFGGRLQVRLGSAIDALACPGLVAELNGERVGLVTFTEETDAVEIVYIEAAVRHQGVGTSLIGAVVARAAGRRLWLVTTNDNLDALRFYQRRGFRIAELHPAAVDQARRRLKPGIPAVGHFGIPVRDEIVLELADDSRAPSIDTRA